MPVGKQFAPSDPYFCLLTSSVALLPVPLALLPVSVFGNRSRRFPRLPVLRDVPNPNLTTSGRPTSGSGVFPVPSYPYENNIAVIDSIG